MRDKKNHQVAFLLQKYFYVSKIHRIFSPDLKNIFMMSIIDTKNHGRISRKLIITAMQMCLALVFLFTITCSAQESSVTGNIRDASTLESLPGVSIVLQPGKIDITTNPQGDYIIHLNVGDYTMQVHSLGYEAQEKRISVKAGDNLKIDFRLKSTSIEMSTVVVSAGKFEQKLDEVVVSMEVLKPAQIENSNQTTMETAIEKVPGVTVIDGQANIRGGSGFSYGAGSRVLVLVDDLPLLAADANDVKWSFLPIENIEQVEILKGASSALFGSSALNGVINLRTAFPKDTAQTIFNFYTGVYDTPSNKNMKWWKNNSQATTGVNFSHRQKFKQLDVVIGGQYFDDNGYRQSETEKRYRLNTNLRYRFKNIQGLSAGIAANVQRSEGGLFLLWANDTTGALTPLGGLDSATTTISIYTTTRATFDPYITYVGKSSSHRIRTRYFLTNNKNNTNQEAKSEIYYGEYLFQHHFKDLLTWSLGLSASNSKVSGDLYSKQSGDNNAAYTQVDLKYKRFNVSAGYRIEQGRISSEKLKAQQLFRAGASYQLLKATHLRTSYGQGFRFPSIAEKFIRTQVGSIVVYPNDSLKSETGWSAEIGIRQGIKINNWRGLIDVSYFQTEYKDMMEFTFGVWGKPTDPSSGFGFKSTNIGNTKITGCEISISGDGNIGSIHQLFLAGFTYINPIQKDFNDSIDTLKNTANYNVLKYRYRRMWKFDSETSYKRFSIGLSARYYSFMENIDKVFEGVIPGVKTYRASHRNGDWVFDANLTFKARKNMRLGFVVKNAFNHEYMTRPADIQPPRSFVVQCMINL